MQTNNSETCKIYGKKCLRHVYGKYTPGEGVHVLATGETIPIGQEINKPKIKCKGCKQEFESKEAFSDHVQTVINQGWNTPYNVFHIPEEPFFRETETMVYSEGSLGEISTPKKTRVCSACGEATYNNGNEISRHRKHGGKLERI